MVGNEQKLNGKIITSNEAKDVKMKVLISETEGWDDYVMRVLEVGPKGFTPHHAHPWPHINYIIEGIGELQIGDKIHLITNGSYAFVPPFVKHQFRNTSDKTLKFICIVPKEGHQ
jgi:quercetin dioxygenase-like cupin family protein